MKMKSLAPLDVWPQSLTNGFLALRKSGTYWIRHTPILSSTDWYTKKEIFVVVWVYFDWDNRFLSLSATNGFSALSRTDEFSALSGTNRYSSPALLNFLVWLKEMTMCMRLC